jgi:hypothetical protein
MTDSAGPERGYRRLLACYPRAFRRENEQEILAVLMDCARDGQQRPGLAESADLIWGALRVRLRPATGLPRTVLIAVRLMCAGAAAELATWITYLVTADSVRSAVAHAGPAQWHLTQAHLVAVEIAAPFGIALWLWMAWVMGRGHDWARRVFTAFFALVTLPLLGLLAGGAAVYAPAELIATAVVWLVQLAVIVLIFGKTSAAWCSR